MILIGLKHHKALQALGLLCALTIGACSDEHDVSGPRPSLKAKPERYIAVSNPAIALLSVELSGGELKQPLLYDFWMDRPESKQSLSIPAGPTYLAVVRGYDRYGELTHQGRLELGAREIGPNGSVDVFLDPLVKAEGATVSLDLVGEAPVKGGYRIVIRPDRKAVYDGESVSLRATVLDEAGQVVPVDPSEIHWAILDPRNGRIDPLMSKDLAGTYTARWLEQANYATLIAEYRNFRTDWLEQLIKDGWADVSAGGGVTCGVKQRGRVYCWGSNSWSMLGSTKDSACFSASTCSSAPLLVGDPLNQAGTRFASVSVGMTHVCALEQGTGNVYCWGNDNISPKLGLGSNFNIKPLPTPLNIALKSISAGWDHTCGVSLAGAGLCWGSGYNGRLGNGSMTAASTPTLVAAPPSTGAQVTYASIAAGGTHSCGITSAGQIFCWGSLAGVSASSPVEVAKKDNGSLWMSLAQGGSAFHTCATNAANNTYCWGEGASGQLGNGTAGAGTRSTAPVLVKSGLNGFTGLVSVAVGETNSCGRKAAGDTYCWGEDSMGELGDGARIQKSTPVGVIGSAFTKISSGDGQSCGIDANQDIYCWGPNVMGQLGIGTRNTWLDQYSNGVTMPTKIVAPIP